MKAIRSVNAFIIVIQSIQLKEFQVLIGNGQMEKGHARTRSLRPSEQGCTKTITLHLERFLKMIQFQQFHTCAGMQLPLESYLQTVREGEVLGGSPIVHFNFDQHKAV